MNESYTRRMVVTSWMLGFLLVGSWAVYGSVYGISLWVGESGKSTQIKVLKRRLKESNKELKSKRMKLREATKKNIFLKKTMTLIVNDPKFRARLERL